LLFSDVPVENDIDIRGFGEEAPQSGNDKEQRKVVIWYTKGPSEKISPKTDEPAVVPETVVTKFTLGRQRVNAKVGDKIRLKSLGFFPGADKVLPECYPILDDLYKTLKDNPRLKIQIQGHICCLPVATNSLARARAETIYIYLVEKGIAKSRLSYTDFGGSRPVCAIPEKSEMEREVNRRVEIEIIEN
jgi:outer membrane protein OmpA-like peptidoglycan-associated protein